MMASQYNHFVWGGGEAVAYNAATGALHYTTEDQIHGIMRALQVLPEQSLLSGLPADIQLWLDSDGFIVSDRTEELIEVNQADLADRSASSKRLAFTILPTLECNLRCPYCFQNKLPRHMTSEVMQKVVTFTKSWFDSHRPKIMAVTWFGGEPLIGANIIEKLSDEFALICHANDAIYQASLITNGTLLSERMIRLLLQCGVNHIQITIDGLAFEHDKRRPYRAGKGSSFERIVSNIDKVCGRIPVSIRINVDEENIDSAFELLEMANKRNWLAPRNRISVHLAPVEEVNEICVVKSNALLTRHAFADAVQRFNEKLLDYAPHLLVAAPPPRQSVCGVVREWSFVINPDFNITKCWNDTGPAVHDPVTWPVQVLNDADCRECEILPLCRGGCPAYRRDGKRRRSEWCDPLKVNLHERLLLTLRARQQVARRDIIESLISKLACAPDEARSLRDKVQVRPAAVAGYWPQQRSPQRSTAEATDTSLRSLTLVHPKGGAA
jgi:uncharacterized protein